ncbi:class I SAM-dependent methyltransferase [Actinoalloteichus hymeniacidonis]|uniref:class I SAM-dependent methyltransferase n=1 Tax=Actinoalloteichus hymeniacidonis TaxID=340345 RepID=UPI000AB3BAC6|nr:class I SAM-dependent methyltransferase [Actinoalloteichus hymeniacidonis]MBB5906905.1 ubiquinone/menaquinone biosynthesis C-methylase UbiE [Actinoalloteichus hymeniacidonis]
MTSIVNTEQFDIWNGADGRHWAEHHARYDAMADGYDDHLFAAVALGEQVLDVGCGTGHTTRLAARKARRGQVTGIDLSAPMLATARRIASAEGIINVTFEQGDAQVYPFPAGRFDTVISRAGVMFFADPVAAFTNIATAITPGGPIGSSLSPGFGR